MKITNKLFLLFFALATASLSHAQKGNDPVIMTINDRPIMKSDFEYMFQKNNQNPATKMDLDSYVDVFVKMKLKVAAAMQAGMDTATAFRRDFEAYRRQMGDPYLVDKSVEQKNLQDAYERMKIEVETAYIYARIEDPGMASDTLKAYKKALQIHEKVTKSNADFEKITLEMSDDPSVKSNRGYLGYVSAFGTPLAFENAIYALKPGEVTAPIRIGNGYFIGKVYGHRPSQGEVHAAHILKMVSDDADADTKARVEKEIQDIYQRVTSGEDFGEVAQKESDDKGNAANGGDLSWFGMKKMIKPFEDQVFSMKVGEISKPFKTKFGWHIVKLIDKRSVPPFEEAQAAIQQKIMRDERGFASTQVVLDRLRKEYNLTPEPGSYEQLFEMANNDYPIDSMFIERLKRLSGIIFRLDGKRYAMSLFGEFVEANPRPSVDLAMFAMKEKIKEFENVQLLRYEDDRLEKKYPAFRHLMDEYRDGSLIFEISNREVWERSNKDREGLEKFFSDNKSKYKWDEPHYKGCVLQCIDKQTLKEAKKIFKKASPDSVRTILSRTLNKEGVKVKVTKGLFEEGQNQVVDQLAFKKKNKEVADKAYPYALLVGKNLKYTPDNYLDVRAKIAPDFQNFLEEQWVKSLRQRFKVEINEEVLKTVSSK